MHHLRRIVPALLLTVALGLGTRLWPAGGPIRASAGGAFYVMFFALLWLGLRPRSPLAITCLVVTLLTCGVEFLQLWHAPRLDALRATPVGGLLLGSTFAWSDFPAYFIGGLVAWPVGRWAVRSATDSPLTTA